MWFVEQAINAALLRSGYQPCQDSPENLPNTVRLEILPTLAVNYGQGSRGGMFGRTTAKRTVSAALAYEIRERQSLSIMTSATSGKQYVDSIDVDNIRSLESNSIRCTQGEIPSDSFFDRILEPFVIVGAAGTAVYLFFHVRS